MEQAQILTPPNSVAMMVLCPFRKQAELSSPALKISANVPEWIYLQLHRIPKQYDGQPHNLWN